MEFFKNNIIPGEVFVQLVAFLVVFFTLRALAWKPILSTLASRREHIRNELEKIEKSRQEIEALKSEYQTKFQKIEDAARSKIQEAVNEGRKIAHEIQEKARAESQETFKKAKDNLTLEAEKARISLRREIADLAINVSERVIKEKMTC